MPPSPSFSMISYPPSVPVSDGPAGAYVSSLKTVRGGGGDAGDVRSIGTSPGGPASPTTGVGAPGGGVVTFGIVVTGGTAAVNGGGAVAPASARTRFAARGATGAAGGAGTTAVGAL